MIDAVDLRKPNENKPLSVESFSRVVVNLPTDLHEYCQANDHVHADFIKACKAMSCRYDDGKLILLAQSDIVKRVEMMQEFHIKNLQQKMKLAERMVGLNQTLAENRMIAEASVEKFSVDSDMVRFVVGQKGVNIKQARYNLRSSSTITDFNLFRKVEGVMRIDINDNVVSIFAKTAEAAKQARQVSCDRFFLL